MTLFNDCQFVAASEPSPAPRTPPVQIVVALHVFPDLSMFLFRASLSPERGCLLFNCVLARPVCGPGSRSLASSHPVWFVPVVANPNGPCTWVERDSGRSRDAGRRESTCRAAEQTCKGWARLWRDQIDLPVSFTREFLCIPLHCVLRSPRPSHSMTVYFKTPAANAPSRARNTHISERRFMKVLPICNWLSLLVFAAVSLTVVPAQLITLDDSACTLNRRDLWCWRPSKSTQQIAAVPAVVQTGVEAVDAGASHACIILSSRVVHCWGSNTVGQLGFAPQTAAILPPGREVVGLALASEVMVGSQHTCVVKTDGCVYCWGGNARNQVSPAADSEISTPTRVQLPFPADTIATSGSFTCATFTVSDEVYCWGTLTVEDGAVGLRLAFPSALSKQMLAGFLPSPMRAKLRISNAVYDIPDDDIPPLEDDDGEFLAQSRRGCVGACDGTASASSPSLAPAASPTSSCSITSTETPTPFPSFSSSPSQSPPPGTVDAQLPDGPGSELASDSAANAWFGLRASATPHDVGTAAHKVNGTAVVIVVAFAACFALVVTIAVARRRAQTQCLPALVSIVQPLLAQDDPGASPVRIAKQPPNLLR